MKNSPLAFSVPGQPARIRSDAIAAIVRKDLQLMGPFSVALVPALFIVCAFFHVRADYPFRESAPFLSELLFWMGNVVLPIAVGGYIVVLMQTDVAVDMHHDWLVRPVAPVEMVAAKVVVAAAVVLAPALAGDLVYPVVRNVPLVLALAPARPALGCCIFLMVFAWLASSPLRVFLGMLGLFVWLAIVASIVIAARTAASLAISAASEHAGAPAGGLQPWGGAGWIESLLAIAVLLAVSAPALWFLLACRRPGPARWIFLGYFTIAMIFSFSQMELRPPNSPKARHASHAAAAPAIDAPLSTVTEEAAMTPPFRQRT